MKTSIFIIGIIPILFFQSCVYQNEGQYPQGGDLPKCDSSIVYFEKDVLPILQSNCAYSGCHDAATAEEDVILDNYENTLKAGVKAGNSEKSELYELIIESDPDDVMPPPPAAKLSTAQIEIVKKWIDQGALNLKCTDSTNCKTGNMSFGQNIQPILANSCTGCHSASTPAGSIDLTTYVKVKNKVNDGSFYGGVAYLAGFVQMPQNGSKLPSCDIDKIKAWIDQGAKDN